jgi:hypothetical protein
MTGPIDSLQRDAARVVTIDVGAFDRNSGRTFAEIGSGIRRLHRQTFIHNRRLNRNHAPRTSISLKHHHRSASC